MSRKNRQEPEDADETAQEIPPVIEAAPAIEEKPACEGDRNRGQCWLVGHSNWDLKTSPLGQWTYKECRDCGRIVEVNPNPLT